jgi:hypothetical protein
MMINVPRLKVEEIEALVLRHHPDADPKGVEPDMPVFP